MTTNRVVRIFCWLFLTGIWLAGCGGQSGESTCREEREALTKPPQGGEVLASIGNETITLKEFEDQLAQLGQANQGTTRSLPALSSFLNSYVNRKLILKEIAKQPVDPQIELQVRLVWENAMINKYLEKTLRDRVVTEDKVRAYYKANKAEFTSPEMIRAAQIMFKIAPQAKPEDKAAAREKAEAALKRLKQGENFQDLARQVSEDETSATRGGDLSYFARGHLPKPFEEAAFALKKDGDVSGIVETPLGFHIIKLLGRKLPEIVPYEQVQEQLMSRMGPSNRQDAYRLYVEELRKAKDVKINNAALFGMVNTGILKDTAEKMGLQTVPPGTPLPVPGAAPGNYPAGSTR